ncbi:glycosyltransferase family 39 protein [Mycobacterium sp. EPa45]|uniref:glycosyltransferase family 39 protein n=1 Tax=Mycobacterium sp. EPa45 TaxID=1545728 RepID=UPI000641E1DA|nr:glycosyltransferase family 39 protein [Mycobacterium sp. EPa45]AKK28269.1 membrane protein [Mycobacterium sp. EPa45]
MSITLRPERVSSDGERSPASAGPLDAVFVAVFAAAVSAAGAARPSLWFDEAATISASTRPVPDLWRMLGNIDAVHGLYYLLMHGWFSVFPATEFWSRLSSSIAVGFAAAGVVVLGRQLSTRSIAVTAGVVFAVLPRVTWAGLETRSYALTMVVAVWLTLLWVAALRRDRPRWWLGYALVAIGATLLNVFSILLLPVHAVMALAMTDSKRTRRHGILAVLTACAATAPFLFFTQTQLFQVGWISPPGARTVGMMLVDQYFDRSLPVAVLSGLLIVVGLVSWRRAGWRPRRLVAITVAWILLPTCAVLVYSLLRDPVYYPRYLSFTAPAMALLLGSCIVALGRSSRAAIAVVLAVFALVATPNYLTQRGPYAKEGMDYSQVADVITYHAAPGDCLVMDNSTAWKPGPIRPLLAARPAAFAKLHDFGRGPTGIDRNLLWDAHIAVWTWADKMPGCPAIWTVSERDNRLPSYERGPALRGGPRLERAMAYQVPYRFGFRVVERWQFNFAQVTKSIR